MVEMASRGSLPRLAPLGLAMLLAGLSTPPLAAELLYSTDFEAFTAGPDQWIGTEGWLGDSAGVGAHGIDQDMVVELGKTAYLGFNQPTDTLVTVYKTLDHDPVSGQTDRIQVNTLLGIEDSTNGRRDSFFISFYNIAGAFLGAVRFANETASFGIWRLKVVKQGEEQVVEQIDTGVGFIRGELHLLFIDMDFQNNRWQADLDGIPLFAASEFIDPRLGLARDLGAVAAEWQIAGTTTAEFGNNWMLFADCSVWAVPFGEQPFAIDTIGHNPSGQAVITWTGEPGWIYQVEYSDDLANWHDDLPDSLIDDISAPMQVSFTDATSGRPPGRYYRVARSVQP